MTKNYANPKLISTESLTVMTKIGWMLKVAQ